MGQTSFEKNRVRKALAKVNQLEAAAGMPQSAYAVQGTQKFNWSDRATIVVSIFAVAFMIALAAGYIITPGGLVLALGYNAVKPRRTIGLSSDSVSLWEQSPWTGKVKRLLGTQPRTTLQIGEWTTIADHPPVKLSHEEQIYLRNSDGMLGVRVPVASEPPLPPARPNLPTF